MSKQNPREVYGRKLVELGEADRRIVALEADLCGSTMTTYFEKKFPERFFEMGIAEANMVSFAAGLALTGKIPFVNSFSVFAVGRTYDQIRVSVAIGNFNVKIVGSSSALSDFGDGATHQSVEDCAIMRAIPNMTVLVPADANEVKLIMDKMVTHLGPVYLRISRSDMEDIIPKNQKFEIGRPYRLKEGGDITIFASGVMVQKALQAADELDNFGISSQVVNVSSLKPVDEEQIRKFAQGKKGIITAEEHSIIGGLASVITFALKGIDIPVETIAIQDEFGQSAYSHEELLQEYGLTVENIVKSAKKIMEKS